MRYFGHHVSFVVLYSAAYAAQLAVYIFGTEGLVYGNIGGILVYQKSVNEMPFRWDGINGSY